jgi:hypothetical protein
MEPATVKNKASKVGAERMNQRGQVSLFGVWMCYALGNARITTSRRRRLVHHALNRGTCSDISKKEVDHAASERITHDGLEIHEVDLFCDN